MPVIPETELAGPAAAVAAPALGLARSRGSTDDLNVYDDARTYYTAEDRHRNNRAGPRTRTYSQVRDVDAAMGLWILADQTGPTEQHVAEAAGADDGPLAVPSG